MEKLRLIFTYLFAILLIGAGINHVINPAAYASLIPAWLPLNATNYFTALVEITLGGGLVFTGTRPWAAIGTILLMIFFLPFHLYDVFREHPAVGSTLLALIRLPLQFVLIYWAWFVVPKAR
ncbi:MAG: MauE/DoxX family redox-associated membrane protein [Pedobacter sp.]|uniref:DoxX family protein n=1 Tax=Pedobacter sp. TaxID=1411316 RepID=UPI00339A9D22